MIQLSKEMWEFDDDGELYVERAVKFLQQLLGRWHAAGASHSATVVLFARTYFCADTAIHSTGSSSDLAGGHPTNIGLEPVTSAGDLASSNSSGGFAAAPWNAESRGAAVATHTLAHSPTFGMDARAFQTTRNGKLYEDFYFVRDMYCSSLSPRSDTPATCLPAAALVHPPYTP